VVTPEFPRGRFMQRIIHDIQLPTSNAPRAQYLERLTAGLAAGCPEWNVTLQTMNQMMFCGIPRSGYGAIAVGAQPYLIHVGRRADIDVATARARWEALRQGVTERCQSERDHRCDYIEDGTWALFEAADLERIFDARNSDN
jgi:hypothetical protein